jgi:oligopeptide/dipeptide ABC transporter ATP-binding protein
MTAAPAIVVDPTALADEPQPLKLGQRSRLPTKAKAGSILRCLFVLAAIIGPMVAPYSPDYQSTNPALALHGPDGQFLLGTTQSGQDVLSQLLTGIRLTLELAVLVGVVATVLSVVVGVTSAFLGGVWDEFLSLVSNVFLVIPALPLLILLLGYLPQKGQLAMILVLSVLGWPWGARVIRAQTLAIRNRDFVAAARETGESTWRIIAVEIVTNQVSLIAASFVNTVLYAIGASVALAFIGVANLSSWSLGTMLYWAQSAQALQLGAWWCLVPPGLAVAVMGTSLVLLNTGIDEFGSPRLRDAARPSESAAASSWPIPPRSGGQRAAARARASCLRSREPRSPIAVPRGGKRHEQQAPCGHRDLSVAYRTGGDVRASACDLALQPGEIVGLVGESGSGKSTLAYGACRLLRAPAVITGGSVRYQGRRTSGPADILQMGREDLRRLRWREIAIVFQSAMNALNPVLNVRDQILDGMHAHLQISRAEAEAKVESLLDLVGIPRSRLRAYPHELSGGMRQRIMIAMALAADPEIVIMDEPTTALDVVVQRDILGQILELKEGLGFAILFITHDLSLLLELADRIAVMYAGQLMELGTSAEIQHEPAHPYTSGLLNSFPSLHGPRRELAGIPGTPPDLRRPPPGCPFLPRCSFGTDACQEVDMQLAHVETSPDLAHVTACEFELTGGQPASIAAESNMTEKLT